MFYNCLNLGSEGNMNSWDTSSVTNFTNIFKGNNATFDQDLSNWDMSSATSMASMFDGWSQGHDFNNGGSTGINNWDTSNVTDMNSMFRAYDAGQTMIFAQDIGNWDVGNVPTFYTMFYGNNLHGNLNYYVIISQKESK